MNPLNLKSKLVYGNSGYLTKKTDAEARYANIDHPLAGRCMSCKTVVGCLRSEAVSRLPKYGDVNRFPEPGTWADLISTECTHCGARVFLMDAREFKAILDKETADAG